MMAGIIIGIVMIATIWILCWALTIIMSEWMQLNKREKVVFYTMFLLIAPIMLFVMLINEWMDNG